MDNPVRRISANLAANIIALRRQRGITQQGLSALAHLPRSTVTYIESGEGNPSIQNLVKIADALRVSVEELLVVPRVECKLVRKQEIPRLSKSQGTVTVFQLLLDPIPGMQIERMELKPGASMGGTPHVSGSKEYFTCIQGAVEVRVAGERNRVEEGDVLAFAGDARHSYHCVSGKIAIGISVVILAPSALYR
jgi:transcriptional regulator with XRE-family HTH domain